MADIVKPQKYGFGNCCSISTKTKKFILLSFFK